MLEEDNKSLKYQAAFKAGTLSEFQLGMHITTDKLSERLKDLDRTVVVEIEVREYQG